MSVSSAVITLSLLVVQLRLAVADDCYPSCENGGTCSSGICICPSDYYGSYCQYPDYCSPSCENGGICSSGICICPSDYYGSYCQYSTLCSPSCLNGGSCYDGTCFCIDGYSGSYCQISSGGSTFAIVIPSVVAGIFIFGCVICITVLRIWIRSRAVRAPYARPSHPVVPANGRRIVIVSQSTNVAPRPPGAPPPYAPPTQARGWQSSQYTPNYGSTSTGPTPPYSGPTPPYSGPSPSYTAPNQSSYGTVSNENNFGDNTPLLRAN